MTAYLAAAAVVRDEGPYLEEWTAFHRLVGVERFYIYDNGSTDESRDVLAGMPDVTVTSFPGERQQLAAYVAALADADAQWLAVIDADEFLFSPDYLPLPTILREFEQHDAVGACWAMFGTSGVEQAQGDTLNSYRRRAAKDNQVHLHVKSIVQRGAGIPFTPHHFAVRDAVDELHRPLNGAFARSVTWNRLRVNHYHTRSIEEARAKQKRPRPDNGQLRGGDLTTDEYNVQRDDVILPYVPLLHARRFQEGPF